MMSDPQREGGEASKKSKSLVRGFSRTVKLTNEPLAEALARKEEEDALNESQTIDLITNLRNEFEDDLSDVITTQDTYKKHLDKECKSLLEAWSNFEKKLCKNLPKAERQHFRQLPPSIAALREAVGKAKQQYDDKRDTTRGGKLEKGFGTVCRNLDNHKDLLAFIPKNDKYVSLITGCATTVVKAMINHEDIVESVSHAIDDMSEETDHWRRLLCQYKHNVYIERYVTRLYLIVFKCYLEIFNHWYSANPLQRFLRSFDQGASKAIVASSKDEMEQLKNKVKDEMLLETGDVTHQTFERVGQANLDLQKILTFLEELREGFNVLGLHEQDTLRHEGMTRIARIIEASTPQAAISETPQVAMSVADALPSQVEDNSQAPESIINKLQKYLQPGLVEKLLARNKRLNISRDVYHRLQKWSTEGESKALWIRGPVSVPRPSLCTKIAASVVQVAIKNDVSVAAYFCAPQNQLANLPQPRQVRLMNLVYSLLAQLAMELPPETARDPKLVPQLEALDEIPSSTSKAIGILKELISSRRGILFVVIDNIQTLEDAQDLQQMADLGDLLSCLTSANERTAAHTIRVCLTTDGRARCLASIAGDNVIDTVSFAHEVGEYKHGVERTFDRLGA